LKRLKINLKKGEKSLEKIKKGIDKRGRMWYNNGVVKSGGSDKKRAKKT